MNALKVWRTVATGIVACAVGAGLAYAKLPQPPMDDAAKAKAAAAKAKAGEAAKLDAERLARAMDRAVEHYKKSKGIATATEAPAPAVKKKK
jgi:hypothetical protein